MGFLWPMKFVVGVPQPGTNEVAQDTSLDDAAALRVHLPAYLFVLMSTARVFFTGNKATFKHVPKCVHDATEELMQDELADLIAELTARWPTVDSTKASTFQAATAAIIKLPEIKELKAKSCQLEVAMNRVFEKGLNRGRKNLLKRRADSSYQAVPSTGREGPATPQASSSTARTLDAGPGSEA